MTSNTAVDLTARVQALEDRLRLITRAALERIDGDSSQDTHWSEIIGIANGDPRWLQHAKANYEVDHAQLVRHARRLVESLVDSLPDEGPIDDAWRQHEAACIADSLEQEILPEMFLAEDGRVFLRGQGKPYPRVDEQPLAAHGDLPRPTPALSAQFIEREIAVARAEAHAVGTDQQLEAFTEDRMRLAFDLGVAHAKAVMTHAVGDLLAVKP